MLCPGVDDQWGSVMSEEDTSLSANEDRRRFLQNCGRFAVTVPPAMTIMLSTSLTSTAIAASSGGGGGGSRGGDGGKGDRPDTGVKTGADSGLKTTIDTGKKQPEAKGDHPERSRGH